MRRGQVALIVAMIVVVGVTLAVSIASRSVTTISVSTQEEERSRSFSAAEAGIEDALNKGLSNLAGAGTLSISLADAKTNYVVTRLTNIAASIDPGQIVTVDWTKSDSGTTSFSVNWTGNGCTPTLVATEILNTGSVFHSVDATSPATFTKGVHGAGDHFVSMRVVGCASAITMSSTGGALSFFQVNSTGEAGSSTSEVRLVKSEPVPLGLFGFSVMSGGDIQ